MKLTETLLSINLFFQQNISTTIFTLLASSYIASKTTPENEKIKLIERKLKEYTVRISLFYI